VTISALQTPSGKIRLVVTDTGIGITPDQQKEVFQPFRRLGAEYTNVEGTGIGLALSHRLVEAMHGSIGFTSEAGRGSTFWIEFPMTVPVSPQIPETLSEAPRAETGGYSLLYVEDNPASLRLMEHLLSVLPNVAMLAAPTPQLGLDMAVAHRPDVIVLDLNLPVMSGFEVLARLKAMPETRDIPVLALTAAAFPRDIKRGLEAGFFRYLTKPFDVKAFLAAVDAALAFTTSRASATG
jgi:CheY-like chemotaxis protein